MARCLDRRLPARATGRLLRAAVALAALSAQAALPVPAAGAAAAATPSQRVEVKRLRVDEPDEPSLVFLRENRVFLRAELDRLRQLVKSAGDGQADVLDARLVRLRELAAAVAAARDTAGAAAAALAARERLESVAEIAALESHLDLLDALAAAQKQRLAGLESDFLGQQRTALVIVVGGFTGRQAPDSLVVGEGDASWHIALSPGQRQALEQGGVAQVYHAFVEPRRHEFSLEFAGAGWSGGDRDDGEPLIVPVDTPRDRLTFLEVDLGGAGAGADRAAPSAIVWQR